MPGRPVTAIALACALGRTTAEVWTNLRAGRTGLAPPSDALADDLGLAGARRSAPLGVVPGELAPLPPGLAAFDTRCARLLAHGLAELGPAVAKAVERYGAGRVAVVLGTSTAGIERTERAWAARRTLLPDFDLERQHAFGALVDVTRALTGARGPGWVVSTACSSSAKVLGDALRLLDGGLADAVITGGVDSLCRTTLHGFASLEVLSLRGCRPFAADRDGISIGEGAGLLLVERRGHGPRLLAVGESSDAHHASAPHPEGLGARLAIEAALARAGTHARDVGHVNAHGTGTPQNDVAEAKAIRAALPGDVLVSSTKGATGHLLGAAGGVEAAFALLACEEGVVPPSLGAEPLAPDLGLRVATTTTRSPLAAALSTSLAFGGSNAVVAVRPGDAQAQPGRPPSRTPALVVKSVGLWAPGWPSVDAWRARAKDAAATEPAAALLPARLKRRTSLLTRLVAEVLGQTKANLARVPVVHATAWGELQVTAQLLESLAKKEELSPAAFSGSVQNTATGTCSIALGSHAPTTTIAAGRATTAMGLLAAWQWLRDLRRAGAASPELVLVVADEALGAPFDPALHAAPLAVAFHLGLVETPAAPEEFLADLYQALGISPAVTDPALLDRAFETALAKLESVRAPTSKGSNFVEFMKEELRRAHRTLRDPELRQAYCEALRPEERSFRQFVAPVLALGVVPRSLFDMLVVRGAVHGLTVERAREVILEMAQEVNATVQTDGPATPVVSAPPPVMPLATLTELAEAPAAAPLAPAAPPELAASFAAPALSLLDAVLAGRPGIVELPGPAPDRVWRVQLGDPT